MRVLHLYSGNLYGGIERIMASLAELHLLTPDMQSSFGLCFEGRLARELRGLKAEVIPLGTVRTRYPWQVRAVRTRVRQLLAGGGWDVAVTHSCWCQGLFAPAVRAAGTPLTLWLHGTMGGEPHWEAWARRYRPDRVLAASRTIAATVPKLYENLKPEVVYCPVQPPSDEIPTRNDVRRDLATPPDEPVVLMAARLEPYKGLTLLLDALGRLPAEVQWTAWIAGGAQRPHEQRFLRACRAQARRLGLEPRLRWLGERQDVDALMRAADLFCHPNLEPEPLGRVFAEALWAGLPIIATAMGGAAEVVTAETGELTAPEPACLAAALADWLVAPERRRRAAAEAPRRAQVLFDPARQMTLLERELRAAAA